MVKELETATERYARAFYDMLDSEAVDEKLDGKKVRLWKGAITRTFGSMGISVQYYSKIRTLLMELECIQYVQRGSKGEPTILALLKPPPKRISQKHLTAAIGRATLPQVVERLARVERLTQALDSKLGGINLLEALEDFEKRLQKLEKAKKKRESKTGGK